MRLGAELDELAARTREARLIVVFTALAAGVVLTPTGAVRW